ncbi:MULTISPECIES: DUF2726 domain-containing protein [unclassified Solwaraspora]|uniref:DUF2726 domain-containing protein n=1 Tax=unclassified Solwaraspora TaxID=2627926 RepID=UPI00259B54AF|nr:DUF2726 domain-containing protein [Solwaraspora sp. WMMA2056]WJK39545.1 DUF2726 domain-containing protein [Solwaraspora sp. WMMA2056]
MTNDNGSRQSWLRPLPGPAEHTAALARGALFERAGRVVHPDRRLSQIAGRRPPGVTTRQWSVATRAQFDFVVCDATDHRPEFVVTFVDPATRSAEQQRDERMTDAVCEALGLELLRVESPAFAATGPGRRIVEYILDARAFQRIGGVDPEDATAGQTGYRDIVGRLPDGRTGYVNDLGAVARARAVEAFVGRQLSDPLLRGLHVRWKDGSAEGWAWLSVREGRFLFERVRICPHRLQCGIEPARFAEDLAAAAVGERLKTLELVEPELCDRAQLRQRLRDLLESRAQMSGEFAFDHVAFD